MSVPYLLTVIALGLPTAVVLSYPFHAWLARRRSRRYGPGGAGSSTSIIVPVKGPDEGRSAVLRRLMDQRLAGDTEWLFCVEDEEDPAVPALRRLVEGDPRRVHLVITGPSGRRLGKLHNLIVGIQRARGEQLVFVDADTILPHDEFLHEFTAPLDDPGVGLVTCWPAYRGASSVPGALLCGSINHDLLGHLALQSIWGGLRLANGSCMAVRRDVLAWIGGLAPQETSVLMDVILARRIHEAGYRVILHHEPVEVPCRTVTWRVWWNQAHRWQVGMARVLSGPFYAWYCWMRSAFPAGLALALFASGPWMALGVLVTTARIAMMLVMGQVFVRDRTQLKYAWLLPFIDVAAAFGCWFALFADRVEWRGRTYRVLAGGTTRRSA